MLCPVCEETVELTETLSPAAELRDEAKTFPEPTRYRVRPCGHEVRLGRVHGAPRIWVP
jgi:hypothetical protein